MPEFLAHVNRQGVVTSAGNRIFDSGAEGIELVFDLNEPVPSGEGSLVGMLWLGEKSLDRTRKTLNGVGVDFSGFEADSELCDAIVGKTFNLVCGLEGANQYHRTDKWVVRFINAPKREAEPGSKSVLAKLKGTVPAQASLDDGDVPF